jgi:hypothetical protein
MLLEFAAKALEAAFPGGQAAARFPKDSPH